MLVEYGEGLVADPPAESRGRGPIRALSPVHTSNNVEATLSKQQATLLPSCCFDNVAILGNNVKAMSVLATKWNVASTLLLVWTGFYRAKLNCVRSQSDVTRRTK